jgi:hypothetical protein
MTPPIEIRRNEGASRYELHEWTDLVAPALRPQFR